MGKEGKIAAVAEVNPLKQGLKPEFQRVYGISRFRCRGKSTKTRIETIRSKVIQRLLNALQR